MYTFDHFSPYKILSAIDNFQINVLPFSVLMLENVANSEDLSVSEGDKSAQKDKGGREGRKSVKVVVPTQSDSEEIGIDLDDDVLRRFSQTFEYRKGKIRPVAFLVSVTQQLDAGQFDFPASHGSQPYLQSSFYLKGNDLPALMHIIGWEGKKSRYSMHLSLKKDSINMCEWRCTV